MHISHAYATSGSSPIPIFHCFPTTAFVISLRLATPLVAFSRGYPIHRDPPDTFMSSTKAYLVISCSFSAPANVHCIFFTLWPLASLEEESVGGDNQYLPSHIVFKSTHPSVAFLFLIQRTTYIWALRPSAPAASTHQTPQHATKSEREEWCSSGAFDMNMDTRGHT